MAKYICIYCLQIKEDIEFNREHVVPKMMGSYKNGLVLNKYQVCEECNIYFSKEIENKIALDSYEAFLRMQHRDKPMTDGRKLKSNRIRIIGDEGIIKGIPFSVSTDKSSPDRIRFEQEPMVGIIKSVEERKYDYYSPDDLPNASEKIKKRMKESSQPIINAGIDREVLEPVLISKGYLDCEYTYSQISVQDFYKKPEFMTEVKMKIDSIMRRVCAKTVFNYLCYSRGKAFVLDSSFNPIREYIRYGNKSSKLWFRYSKGSVQLGEMPNDSAHVVGYMWYLENGKALLCGCLTWFGELTYIFDLGYIEENIRDFHFLDSTKMAYFNNKDQTITESKNLYIL